MPVQDEVLRAACQIASARKDWTFQIAEVVQALPHLNEATVRTHVGSRCCVNAPPNHAHRLPYFRRKDRAHYQVEPKYRQSPQSATRHIASSPRPGGTQASEAGPKLRDTIHAVVSRDGGTYVGECLEVAVVSQGTSLDELVENLQQAIALHLEDEDHAMFGLAEHPRVQLIYDMAIAL